MARRIRIDQRGNLGGWVVLFIALGTTTFAAAQLAASAEAEKPNDGDGSRYDWAFRADLGNESRR